MVNIIIYLDKSKEAKLLIDRLLKENLIANASLDVDNVSYRYEDGQIVQNINTVITVQTKSLLFSEIERLIAAEYGEQVPIYSIPITQSNN